MNAWLLRPNQNGINNINKFRTQNFIAVDYPEIGNLSGLSREDLKNLLSAPPCNLSSIPLGNAYATIDIFVNQMCVGDTVLVADGEDIYFAEITSDYHFSSSEEQHRFSHQRQVRWLSDSSRKELSKELRISLKAPRIAANISTHINEINALSSGNPVSIRNIPTVTAVDVSYPLRSNFMVTFKIPTDMSKTEAERLSTYFRSLYFTE